MDGYLRIHNEVTFLPSDDGGLVGKEVDIAE